MSRYIDADALIDKLMNAIECGRRVDMPTQELEAVLSDVRNAPSINIVRCKECKHYNGEYCFRLVSKDAWDLIGSQCVITMQPDDFCSYGERKESE